MWSFAQIVLLSVSNGHKLTLWKELISKKKKEYFSSLQFVIKNKQTTEGGGEGGEDWASFLMPTGSREKSYSMHIWCKGKIKQPRESLSVWMQSWFAAQLSQSQALSSCRRRLWRNHHFALFVIPSLTSAHTEINVWKLQVQFCLR